jgi:hypothetical protein
MSTSQNLHQSSRTARCVGRMFCAAVILSVVGCSEQSGVPIVGQLTFNGRPSNGEIVIEPINSNGSPYEGIRSVTCFADENGEFATELGDDPALSVNCRISIRIAEQSASGRPAAFDHKARPEKRVELIRIVSGAPINLAITR